MMEKSFRKLSEEQKWILVCLLNESSTNTPDRMEKNFSKISPVKGTRPFVELLDELDEAFIKIAESHSIFSGGVPTKTIAWIHPSYRDLVIDSLSQNPQMRLHYLKEGGIAAIALALSKEGGASGQRTFPLMLDDKSWELLEESCKSQINLAGPVQERAILAIFNGAISGNPPKLDKVKLLANVVCETLRQKWDDAEAAIATEELEQYYQLAEMAEKYVPSPDLSATWDQKWDPVRDIVYDENTTAFVSPEELKEWSELCQLIQKNEPRFLRRIGAPLVLTDAIEKISNIAKNDGSDDPGFDEADEYRSEAERLNDICSALDALRSAFPAFDDELADAMNALRSNSTALTDRAAELEPPGEDWDDYSRGSDIEVFDINELFRDL